MGRNLSPSVIVVGVDAMAKDGSACTWCGVEVSGDDGFRLTEPAGDKAAVFCRLEHVIPWLIKGARWPEGVDMADGDAAAKCAWCEADLGADRVVLVRHRGEHRIADGFCDLDHLGAWARAGGRFR